MSDPDHSNFDDQTTNDTGTIDFALYKRLSSHYLIILIVIGIIGNVISFILFSVTRQLKRIPSSQYLIALSLTDLTFMICLLLLWLEYNGVHWQGYQALCVLSTYLSNTSCLLSGWYIMALTAEMAMAIVDPYRARRYCSRGLVAKRIIVIAIFGCLINIWALIIVRSVPVPSDEFAEHEFNQSYDQSGPHAKYDQWICSVHPEHEQSYYGMTILDTVVSFSIPLLVTLALNITIGCFLLRSLTKRQNLLARKFSDNVVATTTSALVVAVGGFRKPQEACAKGSRDSNASNSGSTRRNATMSPLMPFNSGDLQKKRVRRSRATVVSSLLVTKSLIYLLLNLPNYVHRLWEMTIREDSNDEEQRIKEKLITLAVYLLFYTQYALNFFIYSMHACKKVCRPRSFHNSSERRPMRTT